MIRCKEIFFCLLIFSATSLNGQDEVGISISPSLFEKSINPNEKIDFSIFVYNKTVKGLYCRVMVQDINYLFINKEESRNINKNIRDRSCSEWITCVKDTVYIHPQKYREVKIILSIPPSIQGGYYSMVSFLPKIKSEDSDNKMSCSLNMGTLIALTCKRNVKIDAELVLFNIENSEDQTRFEVKLLNKGNVHISPYGSIVIKNSDNKIIDRVSSLDTSFMFPYSEKSFLFIWDNQNKRNQGESYFAECQFRVQGLGKPLKRMLSFLLTD
jgi:hypothetical protein